MGLNLGRFQRERVFQSESWVRLCEILFYKMKWTLCTFQTSRQREVALPFAVLKTFARLKSLFVLHFGTGANPVTHVDVS